mmetsp:Transcript_29425/g.59834  ORF Transcript_29425/g.59834 Transcript_29425/m.59834 type:complete len:166 (+) Transcript_29425:172-669(+)
MGRYESGNAVKDILGQGGLKWDENKKQGAYAGQKVYDHSKADHGASLRGNGKPPVNRAASFPSAAASNAAESVLSCRMPHPPEQGGGLEGMAGYGAPVGGGAAQGWTNLGPPRAAGQEVKPDGMQQPALMQQGSRRGMDVEVHFREGDHQFGKTTAPSVLSTRPW